MSSNPSIYLVPHSPKEFKDANALAAWLEELRDPNDVNGIYLVASAHYWRSISAGSVCFFHKDKSIVGEGHIAEALHPCTDPQPSPATGKPYEGQIRFDPNTIKIYKPVLPFSRVAAALGKALTFRGIQKLTWEDYLKVQSMI